jgi:hypothetical protein
MRINVYADELNDRFEIVEDTNKDGKFTGLRFNLGQQGKISEAGGIRADNAVTLWDKDGGKQRLIPMLERALVQLKSGKGATEGAGTQRQPAHA